jgi:hypothetical protein
MPTEKTCLDLFCGLGGFSAAFEDADQWDVVTVDIEERFDPDIQADVMELRPDDLPNADVVLASPPCDVFSLANTRDRYWDDVHPVPTDEKSREHVALVFHAVGLIRALAPDYWFLENPRGRLRWFLDEPQATVTYCQYGEDYQKPTDLWGAHPPGMTYRACSPGEPCHDSVAREDDHSGVLANSMRDPAKRAKVPYELSEAVLEAVEGRQEQQTLTAVATDGDESHK